jgi:glycosyltransferase involved in cell wall biosynthesis
LPLERVCLVVAGLGTGGSERQLRLLAPGLVARGTEVTVLVLNAGPWDTADLTSGGVAVLVPGRAASNWAGRLHWLWARVREARPQVVYSLLPVANVACAVVSPVLSKAALIWGVRGSDRRVESYPLNVRLLRSLQGALASCPGLTICNSEAGARAHLATLRGRGQVAVVRNGLAADHFRFTNSGRRELRAQWGVGQETVFTLVGNFDPVKGHERFLFAAALLARHAGYRFVVVGEGSNDRAALLHRLAREIGLADAVVFAGRYSDMPAVYSASDVVVSASSSEGLPNAVAEAMACERMCVVTDVGDSAWLIGPTGVVASSLSSPRLADAMVEAADLGADQRKERGELARERAIEQLSVAAMVDQTYDLMAALAR